MFSNTYSQTSTAFSGTADIVSSTYDGQGDYTIVIDNFRSPSSQYDQFDLQVGQILWSENRLPSQPCNQYKILSINYDASGTITLTTRGDGIIGQQNRPKEVSGAAITTETEFHSFSILMSSQPDLEGFISPKLQNCMMADAFLTIDSIGTNSLDTFYFEQSQDTIFEFVAIYNNGSITRDTVNLSISANAATVNTDGVTIQGDGSNGDKIRVDTSYVATINDLRSFTYEYTVGIDVLINDNTLTLPLPTFSFRKLEISRNGVAQHLNNEITISNDIVTFLTYNFEQNEIITVYYTN